MRRLSPYTLLPLLTLLLPAVMLAGLAIGPVLIAPTDIASSLVERLIESTEAISQNSLIISELRLPRMLLAGLVGLCLAICGTAMQGLFRNPLADPSLIGVSGGASAGASFAIVFGGLWLPMSGGVGLSLVTLGAFGGGFCAVIIVYRLATGSNGTSVSTMLLAGIAISAFAGALNSLFEFYADDDMLRRISLWQMGSLDSATWPKVFVAAVAALLLISYLPRQSRALNALLLGESEARHLGVPVELVKQRLILLTALGIGCSVAVAGTIAFVGLVVPHMIRLLIGPDHRFLIPGTALAGAILLIVADALARILVAPAELPAGILTALLGAPFFFSLLAHQSMRGVGK